jgi:hypothetical protein
MDWRHIRELWTQPQSHTANSKISVSGRRPMPAWEAFTGHSMNSFSCSRTAAPRILITSN